MKRRELLANALGPAMPAEKADDLKPKKSGPRARYFPNFLLRRTPSVRTCRPRRSTIITASITALM